MDQVWSVQQTDELVLQSIKNPFSFYDLVDRLWSRAITAKWPLHRFLSLTRLMGVTHYVEETIELSAQQPEGSLALAELSYEIDSLAIRTNSSSAALKPQIKRLTFFWARDGESLLNIAETQAAGYFIHITVELPNGKKLAYIQEAVLQKPVYGVIGSDGGVNLYPINKFLYLHCSSDFMTLCGCGKTARSFRIHGTFFTQQNLLTHVCAHAALRIGINSSATLAGGRRLTNKVIDDILGIDHATPESRVGTYNRGKDNQGKDIPDPVTRGRGLTGEELKQVLTSDQLGLDCTLLNCKQMADTEFDHFMYPYMESGWPALIGLEGTNLKNGKQVDHVLCALGHTLDPFHWSPEARQGYGMLPRSDVMSAVDWTDHFVINDDGYGMHMTLQSDVVRNFISPSRNASLHVMFVMALRPREVEYDGSNATRIASTVLKMVCEELKQEKQFKPCVWYSRLIESSEIVCRTLHIRRERYIESLLAEIPSGHDLLRKLLEPLPEAFWLTELTLPPLYAGNGRKIGDVIVRTDDPTIAEGNGKFRKRTAKEVLNGQWAFIWLPGTAKFRDGPLIHWPVRNPLRMVGSAGSFPE